MIYIPSNSLQDFALISFFEVLTDLKAKVFLTVRLPWPDPTSSYSGTSKGSLALSFLVFHHEGERQRLGHHHSALLFLPSGC